VVYGEKNMGRTISETTYKRQESLRKRNRLCAATPCLRKATIKQTIKDKETNNTTVLTVCSKHAYPEYANATVTKMETY